MDTTKMLLFNQQKANATTVWILFLFLGWSYGSLLSIGKQLLFYFTLGGFGIWTLVRLFILNGAIKEYNRNVAMRIGFENADLAKLGVF